MESLKLIQRTCETCGNKFFVQPHKVVEGKGKYCSRSCFYKSMERGIKHNCLQCGKQFEVSPSQGSGKYCSLPCWWKARKKAGTAKQRRYLNPRNRLSDSVSRAIRKSLSGRKNGRHWESLVGYKLEDLTKYLESQFEKGMTWDNYGDWHIDHIRPVVDFTFNSFRDEEFKQCWSLWNLQPMWAEENMSKGSRCSIPPLPLM